MVPRTSLLSLPSRLLTTTTTASHQCIRCLHKGVQPSPSQTRVPKPTPFVPDVPTFLSLIGRQMSKHTSKFPTWDDLFTMSSTQLRDAGVEPAQSRRYLLRWRDKFRRGEYGVGGDLENVVDGVAELRVVEIEKMEKERVVKGAAGKKAGKKGEDAAMMDDTKITGSITSNPRTYRRIVNLAPGETVLKIKDPAELPKKPAGFKIHNIDKIKGPYLKFIEGTKGTAGRLQVQEGMWEDKLGRKIDGGERRRAEVRAKKRSEERKKAAV
ncbi:hypothetical protein FQN54_000638 [Arachnomyces sp. PD_36]|nr:hypothetical protein FQN54_000638 [Arachnomyces sp. PD_36]